MHAPLFEPVPSHAGFPLGLFPPGFVAGPPPPSLDPQQLPGLLSMPAALMGGFQHAQSSMATIAGLHPGLTNVFNSPPFLVPLPGPPAVSLHLPATLASQHHSPAPPKVSTEEGTAPTGPPGASRDLGVPMLMLPRKPPLPPLSAMPGVLSVASTLPPLFLSNGLAAIPTGFSPIPDVPFAITTPSPFASAAFLPMLDPRWPSPGLGSALLAVSQPQRISPRTATELLLIRSATRASSGTGPAAFGDEFGDLQDVDFEAIFPPQPGHPANRHSPATLQPNTRASSEGSLGYSSGRSNPASTSSLPNFPHHPLLMQQPQQPMAFDTYNVRRGFLCHL